MKYELSLAGMQYCVHLPMSITILDRHKPFLWECEDADVDDNNLDSERLSGEEELFTGHVRVTLVDQLPDVPEDAILDHYRYYSPSEEGRTWFLQSLEEVPFAYTDRRKAPELIEIYLYSKSRCQLHESNVLMMLLETESIICANGGMMLHGCTVISRDGGLLFTGPSGIGKSTQGELWEKYEAAEILNGDRAGLMVQDEDWYSWGLPFAGSSGIYKNKSVLLKAIIVLEQGKENHMERLSFRESFTCLYPQAHLHGWSRTYMERGTDTLMRLISTIPVYHFICRPDESAVAMVKKEIFDK